MNFIKFCFALLILLLWGGSSLLSQNTFLTGVYGGLKYGGPLPDHKPSGSSGKAKIGPHAGIMACYYLNKKWAIQSRLFYSYTDIKYNQHTGPRDTLYPLHMGDSLFMIPTSYQSNVSGRMKFHSLSLTIGGSYKIFRFLDIGLAPYISFLIYGKDTLSNHVIVGSSAYIDDRIRQDNSSFFRSVDFGLYFHADFEIFRGLYASVNASRSFLNIYADEYYKANTANNAKFYHTYFYMSLGYRFIL